MLIFNKLNHKKCIGTALGIYYTLKQKTITAKKTIMKKFITTALLTVALISGAFAANDAASRKAESKFNAAYPNAENIRLSSSNDHTTISFRWNGQEMKAFYDNDGNEIATTRTIQLSNLPSRAQKNIRQKYEGYVATEAIEMDHVQEGVSYYVSLQNDTTKIILQVSSQGETSVFKKAKL
jgi:hypothetical protein